MSWSWRTPGSPKRSTITSCPRARSSRLISARPRGAGACLTNSRTTPLRTRTGMRVVSVGWGYPCECPLFDGHVGVDVELGGFDRFMGVASTDSWPSHNAPGALLVAKLGHQALARPRASTRSLASNFLFAPNVTFEGSRAKYVLRWHW